MQIAYGRTYLFIGIVIGVLLGSVGPILVKKSQRVQAFPFVLGIFASVCGLAGYCLGRRIGRSAYIDEVLGINKIFEEGYVERGMHWVGVSKWIDKRDMKEYVLLTGKNSEGILISFLNNGTILNHEIETADQQTVFKYHQIARNQIFELLRKSFVEAQ